MLKKAFLNDEIQIKFRGETDVSFINHNWIYNSSFKYFIFKEYIIPVRKDTLVEVSNYDEGFVIINKELVDDGFSAGKYYIK